MSKNSNKSPRTKKRFQTNVKKGTISRAERFNYSILVIIYLKIEPKDETKPKYKNCINSFNFTH